MRHTPKPAVLPVNEDESPSAVAIQNKRSETCGYCPESPVAGAVNEHRNTVKNKGDEQDVAGNAQHTDCSNITGRARVTLCECAHKAQGRAGCGAAS